MERTCMSGFICVEEIRGRGCWQKKKASLNINRVFWGRPVGGKRGWEKNIIEVYYTYVCMKRS
jgi:hypothetical protein